VPFSYDALFAPHGAPLTGAGLAAQLAAQAAAQETQAAYAHVQAAAATARAVTAGTAAPAAPPVIIAAAVVGTVPSPPAACGGYGALALASSSPSLNGGNAAAGLRQRSLSSDAVSSPTLSASNIFSCTSLSPSEVGSNSHASNVSPISSPRVRASGSLSGFSAAMCGGDTLSPELSPMLTGAPPPTPASAGAFHSGLIRCFCSALPGSIAGASPTPNATRLTQRINHCHHHRHSHSRVL
jgi:hypothetical protein